MSCGGDGSGIGCSDGGRNDGGDDRGESGAVDLVCGVGGVGGGVFGGGGGCECGGVGVKGASEAAWAAEEAEEAAGAPAASLVASQGGVNPRPSVILVATKKTRGPEAMVVVMWW